MREYPVIDGRLHAAFFCYIRWMDGQQMLPDETVLKILGSDCSREPVSGDVLGKDRAYGLSHGGWRLLAGDYSYSLWRMAKSHWPMCLIELSKGAEVFAYTRPDAELAHEFIYVRAGEILRERVVESPGWTDQVVVLDFGDPMAGESRQLQQDVADQIGLELAVGLGIPRRQRRDGLRQYRLKPRAS